MGKQRKGPGSSASRHAHSGKRKGFTSSGFGARHDRSSLERDQEGPTHLQQQLQQEKPMRKKRVAGDLDESRDAPSPGVTKKQKKRGGQHAAEREPQAEPAQGSKPANGQTEGKVKGPKISETAALVEASASEQAAWLSKAFGVQSGGLSFLEQGEVPASSLVQLAPAPDRSLASLPAHLRAMAGRSWREDLTGVRLSPGMEAGSPLVLVITSSAKRCTEVLKSLGQFNRPCHLAKLFAKHLKVEEQMKALSARVNIAAGTPDRMVKLAGIGALHFTRLKFVIIDMWRNAKGFSLFEVEDVRGSFWELYKSYIHEKLCNNTTSLCLY